MRRSDTVTSQNIDLSSWDNLHSRCEIFMSYRPTITIRLKNNNLGIYCLAVFFKTLKDLKEFASISRYCICKNETALSESSNYFTSLSTYIFKRKGNKIPTSKHRAFRSSFSFYIHRIWFPKHALGASCYPL
jgi:hypothetical protein